MSDMDNMRVFADQLWKYMVPKLDSKFASNVSYFRAEVVSNPGNNKLEVQRPVENGTLTLPCTNAMSGAQPGQQVVALVMGSMSNAIVVGDGNLNVPGGTGDAGIANFQAQPDGSLVITLINGNTLTATPHDPTKQDVLTFDDVPTQGSNNPVKSGGIYTALAGKQDTLTFDDTPTANSSNPVKSSGIKSALDNKVDKVAGKGLSTNDFTNALKDKLDGIEAGAEVNQNAFANVKVGSTTVAADAEQDTLELMAGNNITITPDATNDKVTIATTAEVNQNAFSNVAVGSVTVSADAKQDTLTLNAGGLVTLTGDATNDSVTIYVDPNHTHITTQVLDLVNADSYGPSGMVSFDADVAEVPLKNCVVDIEPAQTGSGTPSPTNVRAISGWTGANVTRAGKNLLKMTGISRTENGVTFVLDSDSGKVTASGTSTALIYFFLGSFTLCPGTYTLSGNPGGLSNCVLYDNTWTFSDSGNGSTATITKTKTFNFFIRCEAGVNFSAKTVFLPMLRLAAGTDAAFEPFKGEVFNVSFPSEAGTVYGGTLDVLKGTLTVDRALLTLDGTEAIQSFGSSTYGMTLNGIAMDPGGRIISNQYPAAMTTTWNNMPDMTLWAFAYGRNSYVRVRNTGLASVDAFKASLESNHLQVAYPIAEPVIYQLTPELVAALAGQNNFWADCGDVTVEYGAFLQALEGAVENHVHDAEDIASGILPVERGGTGNSTGYVTAGKKSGTTLGTKATAEGLNTTASGSHSHAEGLNTTASENRAHAEGYYAIASGEISHAEGHSTKASGPRSHAEGRITEASGECAHAEGYNTKASGDYSHAEGLGTIASGVWQHVFGKYNVEDQASSEVPGSGAYFEIVGKGSSASNRSNARTLDYAGNEWIAGTLTQASDARLKDVQGEIPDLSSIRAVRFRWKNGDDKEHLGYLAQDVEEIAPYLVDVDSNGYKSLDYIALLTAKVEMLEREIEKLKGDTRN